MAEKKGPDEKKSKGEMSLSGHLKELRNRIIISLVVLFAAVIAGMNFAPGLVDRLLEIGREYGYQYVYLSPQELLMEYVSVALIFAVVVTLPVLLYEIWAFIKPGLKKNENRAFLCSIIFGLLCFCIGVFFAYKIMLPTMLYFLSSLSGGSEIDAAISVQNYVTFLMTIFIIFGIVFELPVVSVMLSWAGIIKVKWMKKARRVVIVVSFVVAALITPPDIVSQIMVAIPIMILYEVSLILCSLVEKARKKRHVEEGDEEQEDEDLEKESDEEKEEEAV